MEKEKYYVDVSVTRYVKRYMVINFGVGGQKKNCFDIRQDKNLYLIFQTYLTSKFNKAADWRPISKKWRTEKIRIEVSKKDFNTRGKYMSPANENKFINFLEVRCRMIMLAYINSYTKVGISLAEAINNFYKVTGWSENSWPSVSIRKIVERQNKKSKRDILCHKRTLVQEINEIIITTLSQNATITNLGENIYEYNSKQL